MFLCYYQWFKKQGKIGKLDKIAFKKIPFLEFWLRILNRKYIGSIFRNKNKKNLMVKQHDLFLFLLGESYLATLSFFQETHQFHERKKDPFATWLRNPSVARTFDV